jgi:hypothetical protein
MQPVVHQRIPRTIVHIIRGRVPPVQIELSITESQNLRKGIVPAVKQREEDHQLHERTRHDADRDQVHIRLPGHVSDFEAAKHGHTESIKQTVGVNDRTDNLGKVSDHEAPVGRASAWIRVPIHKSRRKHEVQILGELGTTVRFRFRAIIY